MKDLVTSGAKGNPVNFLQMAGVLGKMLSETEKVFTPPEDNATGRRRCFTTSEGADDFMDAFVPSGYARGMTLQQYFIHAAAGRMGLISSTQLVGKVGYMFRRLVAALESCCAYGGSVIDTSTDTVVSFKYGDDGRSPYSCEWERFAVPVTKHVHARTYGLDNALEADVDAILRLFPDAVDRVFDVPVSIRRVLFDAENKFYDGERLGVLYTAEALWQRVQQIARTHADSRWGSLHRPLAARALAPVRAGSPQRAERLLGSGGGGQAHVQVASARRRECGPSDRIGYLGRQHPVHA